MNSTFLFLLLRHLYSRGWQRCPREVSWSWCTNWRWCSGDSGLTSHPFCRLPQRDEWHRTDLQQSLLTFTAAHVPLRFRGGVRPHLCKCAAERLCCMFLHMFHLGVWQLCECMKLCMWSLFVLSSGSLENWNFEWYVTTTLVTLTLQLVTKAGLIFKCTERS